MYTITTTSHGALFWWHPVTVYTSEEAVGQHAVVCLDVVVALAAHSDGDVELLLRYRDGEAGTLSTVYTTTVSEIQVHNFKQKLMFLC